MQKLDFLVVMQGIFYIMSKETFSKSTELKECPNIDIKYNRPIDCRL